MAPNHTPLDNVRTTVTSYDYRRAGGNWIKCKTPYDRVLDFIFEELGLNQGKLMLFSMCSLEPASISRIRSKRTPVPLEHLARMHVYTGIPMLELITLGDHYHVEPHSNARGWP